MQSFESIYQNSPCFLALTSLKLSEFDHLLSSFLLFVNNTSNITMFLAKNVNSKKLANPKVIV
jgi:hypothetical protein